MENADARVEKVEIDPEVRFRMSRQTGSQEATRKATEENLSRCKTKQSVNHSPAFWPKNNLDPVAEVAVTKVPAKKVAVTRVPLAKLQLQTSFSRNLKSSSCKTSKCTSGTAIVRTSRCNTTQQENAGIVVPRGKTIEEKGGKRRRKGAKSENRPRKISDVAPNGKTGRKAKYNPGKLVAL